MSATTETIAMEGPPATGTPAALPAPARAYRQHLLRYGLGAVGALALLYVAIAWWWNQEPALFDVAAVTTERLGAVEPAPGSHTVAAVLGVAGILLDKRGGYLGNDMLSPAVVVDNLPSWEFGVVTELRDTARALRNDFSRSQSQSPEDPDVAIADAQFHFDHAHWILPATEQEYAKGIAALERFLASLNAAGKQPYGFHVRADNLNFYLATVEKRLGAYSHRLARNVSHWSLARLFGGGNPAEWQDSTSWWDVDNVFFEARGYVWALLHTLRGVEQDFASVLKDKEAVLPMRMIIEKLEKTQEPIFSPMIFSSSGFGMVTNHSLVMSSYISRANAAVIDLRKLLTEG